MSHPSVNQPNVSASSRRPSAGWPRLPQQARQAQRGPQFEGLRALPAGDVEGPAEAGLRLGAPGRVGIGGPCRGRLGRRRSALAGLLPQQQLAAESVQLRFVETLSRRLDHGQRLGHDGESLLDLASRLQGFDQQGQVEGPSHLDPRGPKAGDALADLGRPFRPPALLGQGPPSQGPPPSSHHVNPLLGGACKSSSSATCRVSWTSRRNWWTVRAIETGGSQGEVVRLRPRRGRASPESIFRAWSG